MLSTKKYFILPLSLGFAIVTNIYFRTLPINFPQLKSQARDIVEDRLLKEAVKEVNTRFPEFNALAKDKLVKTLLSDSKRQKKHTIKSLIQEEYGKLKDNYQDPNGQTYLMELDCWHRARYVDNAYRLGRVGDKVIDGKQIDSLMLAPSGNYILWNTFLFYLTSFLYKIFCLINPIPLFSFIFYIPLFFTTVFIIALYLFCFFRWGNLAALISCLFVGLSPVFLPRSCVGWFDTDTLNLLFPLLVAWMYIRAYDSVSWRLRSVWILLSAFWVGLFCFTWTNWWFIFLIIIVYEIYSLVNLLFVYWQYKEKNLALCKQRFFSLCMFVIFSLLWIMILAGRQPLIILYCQLKDTLVFDRVIIGSIWPNVYLTVAELRKPNLLQIITSAGGILLFTSSLISMLTLFLRAARNQKYTMFERESIVVFTLWFMGMFLAALKGVRFTMFLLLPLGISLAWAVKQAQEYFKNKNRKLAAVFMVITLLFLGRGFLANGYNIAKRIFPLMNDSWYKALVAIGEKTPERAVINSWWDLGDWFKAVSERRVIFDGQSQNLPQAYWMANVLTTDNEEEAIRILRMINNGGNKAFEIIQQYIGDPYKSLLLLKGIILSEPDKARVALLKFLPSYPVEQVIGLLFSNKPEKAYFVVDYTMQGKVNVFSFLGRWDFTKAYIAQNLKRAKEREIINYLTGLGVDKQRVERFYQEAGLIPGKDLIHWFSSQARFHSDLLRGEEKNNIVLFNNGLVYNPKEENVYIYSQWDNRYRIPKSLFVFKQDGLAEIAFSDSNLDFSVLIFQTAEGYQAILLDREVANSLFVRLYFFGGRGLKYFKPLLEEKDGERYIRVFEVIWG